FTPLAVSATLAMVASYFVSRTVSPLYCARYLRPHGHKERFPRWLLLPSLLAAVVCLGVPLLAYGAPHLLDRVFAPEVGDAVAWPFLHLAPVLQRVVVGGG